MLFRSTIIDSFETFFSLFKPIPKESIISAVKFDEFKKIVSAKNKMKFDPNNVNFDTPDEIKEAQMMIDYYNKVTSKEL